MNPSVRCGICGVLLMGLVTAHACVEATHGAEHPPEAVVLTTGYIFGSHEDRAAEFVVNIDIFARRVIAVATASYSLRLGSGTYAVTGNDLGLNPSSGAV